MNVPRFCWGIADRVHWFIGVEWKVVKPTLKYIKNVAKRKVKASNVFSRCTKIYKIYTRDQISQIKCVGSSISSLLNFSSPWIFFNSSHRVGRQIIEMELEHTIYILSHDLKIREYFQFSFWITRQLQSTREVLPWNFNSETPAYFSNFTCNPRQYWAGGTHRQANASGWHSRSHSCQSQITYVPLVCVTSICVTSYVTGLCFTSLRGGYTCPIITCLAYVSLDYVH